MIRTTAAAGALVLGLACASAQPPNPPRSRQFWLCASNEKSGTASVFNMAEGKIEAVVKVKDEPEGVAVTPDGKFVYVTCETKGEVVVVEVKTN